MARLELMLLGGFQARLVPGGAINLPTRKAKALLAYLALPAGRPHARDKLAALLWGDVPESRARSSLRKALFWLRQALTDTKAVMADAETVELRAGAASIDVGEFERRVAEGSATALAEAADLYQGDLLAGLTLREPPFEEWLVGERERLRELLVKALARLLTHQLQAGRTDSAILTAVKLLAVDPLQEPVHRTLMRLYTEAGRRGAALRQYQACVTFLERELRTQPEEATKALYREILQSPGVAASAAEGPAPAGKRMTATPSVAVSSGVGPPLSSAETPLIGRRRELSELTALLNDAWAGGRRLAAIVGEAGVGKSRLAAGLGALAIKRGGRVLLGRCYESEQSLPFSPWIDALRGARLAANGDVVGALSPVWRSELARLLPELADGALPPANPTDALRLFEAVAQCLDALAGRAPLLVILEDLQWADELSFRLGGFLGRRARTGPMLVLGTIREEEVETGGPQRAVGDALAREGLLVRLHLSRLTRDETAALTRELAGASPAPALAALEEEIWRVSEGNPFMIVETVRAVREHRGAPGTLEGLVPARVRDLIAGRLRTLTERGRRLVDVAAVIGRRFEFALLQRASGLDENEAADGVEELVRRRILEQTEDGFEFTHDQIREVHHSDLVAPRRALLHRRVAAALESLHPGDVGRHALALGTHYREAGDWDKAVSHLRQAGLIAASRYAGREAAACFEEALRALDHLPESRQSQEQRFELSLSLNRTQYWSGQFARAMTGYRDAERLAHALGDNRRLGQVLGALVYLLTSAGRYVEAIDSGQRALAIAEATADRALRVWASVGLGRSYFAVGDYRRGAELTQELAESMDEAELDEHLRPAALHPSVGCRTWLALCLERLGSFDESLRWAEDAVRIADGLDSLQAQVWAWYTLGHVRLARGNAELSIPALERALALCEKGEFPVYRPRVLGALGQALAFTGKIDAGLALLEQALTEARATQVLYGYTSLLIAEAETHLEGGRLNDAARVAAEALPPARERGERGDEAWLSGVLGAIALRRGRQAVGEATTRLEEAIAVARELAMRPLEARSLAGLGEAHLLAGRRKDAHAHLAEAVSLFRSAAMHRWLVLAEALLAVTV
jgi:DNA-binding SARP family transcriptional activator